MDIYKILIDEGPTELIDLISYKVNEDAIHLLTEIVGAGMEVIVIKIVNINNHEEAVIKLQKYVPEPKTNKSTRNEIRNYKSRKEKKPKTNFKVSNDIRSYLSRKKKKSETNFKTYNELCEDLKDEFLKDELWIKTLCAKKEYSKAFDIIYSKKDNSEHIEKYNHLLLHCLFLEGSYEKLLNESISQLSKKSKDDIAFYFMSLALVKQNKSKAILQFLIELLFKIKDRQLIIIGLELVIANYLERKRVEEAAYFIDIYGKINPKSFRLINMYRDLEKINLHSKNLHNKKTK